MTAIRSALYVPGDRPALIDKALASDSDSVIIDLEDAVSEPAKDIARAAVSKRLADYQDGGGPQIWVRVNSGRRGIDDAAAVASPSLTGLCLAKASSPADILAIADAAGAARGDAKSVLQIEPLIESALGLVNLIDIAKLSVVSRIQLGEADLCSDLGIREDERDSGLAYARAQTIIVSTAAALDQPMAPVNGNFHDLDAFRSETHKLAGIGFFGRVCIHPAQVAIANAEFTPTSEELETARNLISNFDSHVSAGRGVFATDGGRVIDEAVVRNARRLLTRATSISARNSHAQPQATS